MLPTPAIPLTVCASRRIDHSVARLVLPEGIFNPLAEKHSLLLG